jgi:hypothetical protein
MASGTRTLDIWDILQPDELSRHIANKFVEWESQRNQWLEQKAEIQEYLFATDTSGTTNAALPWKNSVHIPKLCQIRDNLNANYMAALFPNDRPIAWEGDDESSESKTKREVIEAYMANKMRMGKWRSTVQQLVNDYVDAGNVFAMPEFVAEEFEDPITGEKTPGFVGPRAVRISPYDIVFNPTAPSFEESPKIIRELKSLGTLKADMADHPEMGYLEEVFNTVLEKRHRFSGLSQGDFKKTSSFQIDGFGSFLEYFQSEYVELLHFYGDIYDIHTKEFKRNRVITIVDRCHVIRDEPCPTWSGKPAIFHCGWRLRPDNLYAMGPLDNLVGMQYRIDHLENAKSDAFDLILHPVMKIKGYVEDFEYGPGERIYCGDEGDVEFQSPDTTMLNADTQIAIYEAKMEEMAGAPKQAMGFRTPGEKTAYEVQVLENGANRVFLNKSAYFEEHFLEPLLNSMLETARRNMGPSDLVKVMDDQFGVAEFMNITKEDIMARGKIRPIGARRFARNANILQNLTQLASSPLGQDAAITAHISGIKMAKLIEELLDLDRFDLVQDNIRIAEMLETEQLKQSAQQMIMEQGMPDNANPMVQPPTQG